MKKLYILAVALLLTTSVFAYDGLSTTMDSGRAIVTTAGTAVQISTSATACQKIIITAETDNTGTIVVGGPSVVASQSTRQGVPLAPGNSVTLLVNSLDKVWLDSTVNGDGVTYVYFHN